MTTKNPFSLVSVLALLAAGGVVFAFYAGASSEDDIVYPVAQFENCTNEQECRAYCDDLDHAQECLAFAEQHNLMSPEELAEAKKFLRLGIQAGPGGCRGKVQCEAYCEDVSNIEECLVFAEQHGIMDAKELDEARKVAAALRQGAQLPGGCQSKAACEAYCQGPSHMEECVEFAIAAGFIPQEEADEVRRILPLMKEGRMPGGCREKEECEAYCALEENTEECTAFFVEAGFMTAQEAEMFRKTGGKGPGECSGREECEAFCNDPANQAVCFEFAKEHDLIQEHELTNMQEGISRFREGFRSAPPEVAQCLKEKIGEEVLAKIESGTFLPNPELGEHMKGCFEEFLPRSFEGEHGEGFGPPGDEGGEFTPPPEARDCVSRILGGQPTGPPTPEQEQRIREECFPQQIGDQDHFEGSGEIPPEFIPPDGVPQEFHEEFQGQFEQEFEEQYQEQFREELERQYQEEFQRQIEQQTPPPQEFHEEPVPETSVRQQSFLGAVLEAMQPGLRVLFPFLSL